MTRDNASGKKLPAYKDPQATPEQILRLPLSRRVTHPNLPLNELIFTLEAHRSTHPNLVFEVIEKNPSFALWELTEADKMPRFWWVACSAVFHLIQNQMRKSALVIPTMLAAESAAGVLPLFESDAGADIYNPRKAVLAALRWAYDPDYFTASMARDAAQLTSEKWMRSGYRKNAFIIEAANKAAGSAYMAGNMGRDQAAGSVADSSQAIFGKEDSRSKYLYFVERYERLLALDEMSSLEVKAQALNLFKEVEALIPSWL